MNSHNSDADLTRSTKTDVCRHEVAHDDAVAGRRTAVGDRIWVADMEPSKRYPLYTRGNTGEVFPHVLSALGGTLMGDDVGRAQMEVFR